MRSYNSKKSSLDSTFFCCVFFKKENFSSCASGGDLWLKLYCTAFRLDVVLHHSPCLSVTTDFLCGAGEERTRERGGVSGEEVGSRKGSR